jgi:hypothetical protein
MRYDPFDNHGDDEIDLEADSDGSSDFFLVFSVSVFFHHIP